jgi:type IV secretion system protein VirB8
MNDESRKSLDDYYAQAGSWNRDRLQAMRSSRRIAWWVAGAAGLIAVLEAGALLLLTPLKTVEPYTLLVDRTTGYVQALKPLEPAKVAPDTALTQSFLVQYVIAREGFDLSTVNASYRKVALFSADRARSSYLSQMQVSNPGSPLVALPRGATVEARVKSISPVGRDVALVRFDTVRVDPNGQAQPPQPWIATVRYRWSGEPMKLEDRFVNPLGFQITSYRRDPEALPVSDTSGARPAAAPPPPSPPLGAANVLVTPAPARAAVVTGS